MARIGFQIVGWTADQGIDEARLNNVLNQMERMLKDAGAKNVNGEADIPGFHGDDNAVNFRFSFDLPAGQQDARQFAANALKRWYGVGGARLANFTSKSDRITLAKGTAIVNKNTGQSGVLATSVSVEDPDNFYDSSGVMCSVAKAVRITGDSAIGDINELLLSVDRQMAEVARNLDYAKSQDGDPNLRQAATYAEQILQALRQVHFPMVQMRTALLKYRPR